MGSLDQPVAYLSLIVFLPAIAALALVFFPKRKEDALKFSTLGITIVVFLLTLGLVWDWFGLDFKSDQAAMQNLLSFAWIPSFGIQYCMGLDGISFPLVMLTAFISVLAMDQIILVMLTCIDLPGELHCLV